MAGEDIISGVINDSGLVNAISTLPGIAGLIKIGQVAGIVVIVYVVFLILKSFFQIKQTMRMGKLVDNVKEINQKMDILICSKGKKSSETKSKKSKSKKY